MANYEKHKDQYIHNKEFLLDIEQHKLDYKDWKIVIMFYCGVHMIECVLSGLDKKRRFKKQNEVDENKKQEEEGIHSKNHRERRRYVCNFNEFKTISTHYSFLSTESHKARYRCFIINEKDVNAASKSLSSIEAGLQTYLI